MTDTKPEFIPTRRSLLTLLKNWDDHEGYDPDRLQPWKIVPLVKRQYHWLEWKILAVADLAGDGSRHVVLKSADVEHLSGLRDGRPEEHSNLDYYHASQVIVLDSELNPVATNLVSPLFKHDGRFKVELLTDSRTGRSNILVLRDRITVLRYAKR